MTPAGAGLRVVSPSRLDTWVDCPRRYRWRYQAEPPQPRRGAFAHTTMGAAVHAALRGWWAESSVPRRSADVADDVERHWSDAGFADRDMSQRWLHRSQQMVARYVEAETARWATLLARGIDRPVRVETALPLRVRDDLVLAGRPDRVDERPVPGDPDRTELVVVDYKTAQRPLTDDDARASRTLAIYAAAAQAVLRRPATRVELHHVTTGRIARWQHDLSTRDRHVQRAVGVADDIVRAELRADTDPVDEVFPPRPGPLCGWCDYRDSCSDGAAAAPAVDPWAALEPTTGASGGPVTG